MSKRFYVEMVVIMIVSVVLLGLSYSKETGPNIEMELNEKVTDSVRVVFLNNPIMSQGNPSNYISVINKSSETKKYRVYITEINHKDYSISASIDNDNAIKVVDGKITEFTLKPFGSNGDQKSFMLFLSIVDSDLLFEIHVEEVRPNYLKDSFLKDRTVYKDSEENYRYYGMNVNNYIKYDNKLYRIIGLIDNKFKLLSVDRTNTSYQKREYASLKDYLGSLGARDSGIENIHKLSWMAEGNYYWLSDEVDNMAFYVSSTNGVLKAEKNKVLQDRSIRYLNDTVILAKGNGTKNNPYEVSYGNK